MSFTFKWPRFSDQFHANAIQMLESALNKGNKPPVIADKIEVVELEMGTQVSAEFRQGGHRTLNVTSLQSWKFGTLVNSPWTSFAVSFASRTKEMRTLS